MWPLEFSLHFKFSQKHFPDKKNRNGSFSSHFKVPFPFNWHHAINFGNWFNQHQRSGVLSWPTFEGSFLCVLPPLFFHLSFICCICYSNFPVLIFIFTSQPPFISLVRHTTHSEFCSLHFLYLLCIAFLVRQMWYFMWCFKILHNGVRRNLKVLCFNMCFHKNRKLIYVIKCNVLILGKMKCAYVSILSLSEQQYCA